MITNEDQHIEAVRMLLEIAWSNPGLVVQAQLRAKESSNPYCRWGEQSRRILARRANWNANHRWAG